MGFYNYRRWTEICAALRLFDGMSYGRPSQTHRQRGCCQMHSSCACNCCFRDRGDRGGVGGGCYHCH
jgi:hypothetical protein